MDFIEIQKKRLIIYLYLDIFLSQSLHDTAQCLSDNPFETAVFDWLERTSKYFFIDETQLVENQRVQHWNFVRIISIPTCSYIDIGIFTRTAVRDIPATEKCLRIICPFRFRD